VIETAKRSGLEPFAYLRFVLEALPGAKIPPACTTPASSARSAEGLR
jgi:hypothetical protein